MHPVLTTASPGFKAPPPPLFLNWGYAQVPMAPVLGANRAQLPDAPPLKKLPLPAAHPWRWFILTFISSDPGGMGATLTRVIMQKLC